MEQQNRCSVCPTGSKSRGATKAKIVAPRRAIPDKLSFFDLPGEIRNEIYHLAYAGIPDYGGHDASYLAHECYYHWSMHATCRHCFQTAGDLAYRQVRGSGAWFFEIPSLWGVSKQVRREAEVFCPKNAGPVFCGHSEYPGGLRSRYLYKRTLRPFEPITRLSVSHNRDCRCGDLYRGSSSSRHCSRRHGLEAYGRCFKAAKAWNDPKNNFIILLRLIDERMPHLRHLILSLCTEAMRIFERSVAPEMDEDGSHQDHDEPVPDDGQWKNSLLIRSLASIQGLRHLQLRTKSHPRSSACPSWRKVTKYLEWRMRRHSDYGARKVVAARHRIWETARKTWPDEMDKSFSRNLQWFHDLDDDYVGLFEDRVPTSKRFCSHQFKDEDRILQCLQGQTNVSHPIVSGKAHVQPSKEEQAKVSIKRNLQNKSWQQNST